MSFLPRHLLGRIYLFIAFFFVESLFCFSGSGLLTAQMTLHLVALTMVLVVAGGMLLGFGYSKLRAQREELPFNIPFFILHILCMGVIFAYAIDPRNGEGWYFADLAGYGRSAAYFLGTLLLALACIPLQTWHKMLRAAKPYWAYALLTGLAAWASGFPIRSIWRFSQHTNQILQVATFNSVLPFLRLVLPGVTSDAVTSTITTPRYSGTIGGRCAGMEGLGLVFVFCVVWLWYSRKECRFPRVLLIVPCGLVCIWALNIFRLCALYVIGDRISPDVADIGFHSQFGWIAFTAVALAISLTTQKMAWVRKPAVALSTPLGQSLETAVDFQDERVEPRGESAAIRAYLIPFLAILAAAAFSKLASAYFDWLYPLRFIAAAIALYYFWPELKKLNWRFGWFGVTAGAAIFLIWIAPSWWLHSPSTSLLGSELTALSPLARWTWITFRVAAAVITVPIAEELAFRGYLARRLVNREFDQLPFTSLTLTSICLSSLVFGIEHMKNLTDWRYLLLGTVAGLFFAAALRWRGRIGDAVAAHAVSNLLLAIWVLGAGDWGQW